MQLYIIQLVGAFVQQHTGNLNKPMKNLSVTLQTAKLSTTLFLRLPSHALSSSHLYCSSPVNSFLMLEDLNFNFGNVLSNAIFSFTIQTWNKLDSLLQYKSYSNDRNWKKEYDYRKELISNKQKSISRFDGKIPKIELRLTSNQRGTKMKNLRLENKMNRTKCILRYEEFPNRFYYYLLLKLPVQE